MVRRYRYHNPHDASPHYGMLKCLIGLVVSLCIWNVWTCGSPDPTSYTTSNSKTYSYNSNDGRMIKNSEEKEGDQKRRSKQQYKTSYSSSLTNGRSTVEDPYLKVSSSVATNEPLVKNNQLQSIPMTVTSGHRLILMPLTAIHELRQGEDIHSIIGLQVQQQQQQINHSLRNTQVVPQRFPVTFASDNRPKTSTLPINRDLSKYLPSNDIHLSQPVQTHSRLRSSTSSSPRKNSTSSSYTRNSRRHLRWSHFIYAVAVSCSLLAGGVFARRALERIDRWEQLCKEDSLAFDLAFTSMATDAYSDVSYGSAGSKSSTDWSGDYLDRFDV